MPATAVSAQLFHSLLKVASTAVVDSSGNSSGMPEGLAPRALQRNAGGLLGSAAQAPERLSSGNRVRTLEVPASDGAALAWLHAHGEVIGQNHDGERMIVEVRLSDKDLARFEAR